MKWEWEAWLNYNGLYDGAFNSSNDDTICEYAIDKDMEGSSHGLIWNTIPTFFSRDYEKPQETSG
jgi:GH35 family endo-1,4-beta-xylanase